MQYMAIYEYMIYDECMVYDDYAVAFVFFHSNYNHGRYKIQFPDLLELCWSWYILLQNSYPILI